MKAGFEQLLLELGGLSESVVVSVEITNLLRDVSVVIDRVVDTATGQPIDDIDRRVVHLALSSCRSFRMLNNLNDRMSGLEANWGLNELQDLSVRRKDDSWDVDLRWSGDIRRISLVCSDITWRYLPGSDAKTVLGEFYGSGIIE